MTAHVIYYTRFGYTYKEGVQCDFDSSRANTLTKHGLLVLEAKADECMNV